MGMTKRGAAPNQEWVLMYRAGLSRARIAELVRVPAPTVGYHLRLAAAKEPGLRDAHKAAAARKTTVTTRGVERMQQLVTLVQDTGRYPSRTADSTSERTLATWLLRRREDLRDGTLAQEYRDGLAVLPGWEGKPRVVAAEERWRELLTTLVAYRAAGNDWPRRKALVTREEHELGVWLHIQRYRARRGDLDPQKVEDLDAAVPGWRTGRRRGRKPLALAGKESAT
jgi:hypothetical protein